MNLLNQVRAVAEGMIIGCWVGGGTLVRFKVGKLMCATLCRVKVVLSTLFPCLIIDATTPQASPALLLTADTELIVAPKTRNTTASTSSITHDLASDESPTSKPEWDRLRRRLLRLLPETLVAPSQIDLALSDSTAFVSPESYRQFQIALPSMRCILSHRTRPTAKVGALSSDREKEKERSNGTNDKDIVRTAEVEVRIAEAEDVPSGHIWINDRLRNELKIPAGSSYELLKFVFPCLFPLDDGPCRTHRSLHRFQPPLSITARRLRESKLGTTTLIESSSRSVY